MTAGACSASRLTGGSTLWWGDAAEALGLDADLIDRAVHHAMRWVDMTPGEIDILRRVVLHVAGRTP